MLLPSHGCLQRVGFAARSEGSFGEAKNAEVHTKNPRIWDYLELTLESMKLPNGKQTVIPMSKLIGYCLNPEHSSGKHKARVFASALGITSENADELRELLV